VEELERGHEQPAVRVVLVDFLSKLPHGRRQFWDLGSEQERDNV
jgi:hypothetical protein